MRPLQLKTQGHPILKDTAKPVTSFGTTSLKETLDALLQLAFRHGGVGIAAPQGGIPEQIFIMASAPNARYPGAPAMEPTEVINPKILRRSRQQKMEWEGCLSVPGLRGKVSRPQWVEVEYRDVEGRLHRKKFRDFLARLFLHEYDHLQGTLFPDRMTHLQYMRAIAKTAHRNKFSAGLRKKTVSNKLAKITGSKK